MNVQKFLEQPASVSGTVNYAIDHGGLIRFHAKNSALDTFDHDPQLLTVTNGRTLADAPSLDREGFALIPMETRVEDFRDTASVGGRYAQEIVAFIGALVDADAVVIAGPGALRFGERAAAGDREQHNKVARLVHSDTSVASAEAFTGQYNPHPDRQIRRTAHHNIWRTFSKPPQDLPLALCDFRSAAPRDLIEAEAAFDDPDGNVVWSFGALLFAYNPEHRWHYFPDMMRDEVLVFKRYDTDRSLPWFVPHTAFPDSQAPPDAEPRASIEMRTISYWYE